MTYRFRSRSSRPLYRQEREINSRDPRFFAYRHIVIASLYRPHPVDRQSARDTSIDRPGWCWYESERQRTTYRFVSYANECGNPENVQSIRRKGLLSFGQSVCMCVSSVRANCDRMFAHTNDIDIVYMIHIARYNNNNNINNINNTILKLAHTWWGYTLLHHWTM